MSFWRDGVWPPAEIDGRLAGDIRNRYPAWARLAIAMA
jgi:hypothetical protein